MFVAKTERIKKLAEDKVNIIKNLESLFTGNVGIYIETIEYLNEKFKEMNQKRIYSITDLKCNFDVEIGRDMLLDYEKNNIDTFILWSGDSDFYDPIAQLLSNNKKVILFATVKRVASELNDLQENGLMIFDIKKIKEFICWKKQI